MRITTLMSCVALTLAGLLCGCSSTGGAMAQSGAAAAPARITDAFGREPGGKR